MLTLNLEFFFLQKENKGIRGWFGFACNRLFFLSDFLGEFFIFDGLLFGFRNGWFFDELRFEFGRGFVLRRRWRRKKGLVAYFIEIGKGFS